MHSFMVSKNLSVCLSVTYFDPKYLLTGRIEWAEIFLGHLCQNECSQKIIYNTIRRNYKVMSNMITILDPNDPSN